MKKLDRAIIIISRIVEVFLWVGCGLSIIITILFATGKLNLVRYFTSATPETPILTSYGFTLNTLDAAGKPMIGAFVLFFITLVITFALMALCARNVYLIFKTSQGLTAFSKGKTPFQEDNIRMVREIGVFLIAIPAVQLVMSFIATLALGLDAVESSVNLAGVFVGLVVLALSRYFAYGAQLQDDVDGLV